MNDDPYKVLGVEKTATQDQIKKAYRKLAKALHPDLHPDDSGKKSEFQAVSAANDLLSDPEKRSQYDTLALNMRTALPNASFIAFTGTPLIVGEEKTREVFGDYVSVYNFRQSVEDGATVPLWYENRIPELQLTNDDLNTDVERVLEDIELDDQEERAHQDILPPSVDVALHVEHVRQHTDDQHSEEQSHLRVRFRKNRSFRQNLFLNRGGGGRLRLSGR